MKKIAILPLCCLLSGCIGNKTHTIETFEQVIDSKFNPKNNLELAVCLFDETEILGNGRSSRQTRRVGAYRVDSLDMASSTVYVSYDIFDDGRFKMSQSDIHLRLERSDEYKVIANKCLEKYKL